MLFREVGLTGSISAPKRVREFITKTWDRRRESENDVYSKERNESPHAIEVKWIHFSARFILRRGKE